MEIFILIIFIMSIIFYISFNNFVIKEYYKNHPLYESSDNYVKNDKDPYY